jgi:hypothetical protein
MLRARNETSHTYEEEKAREMYAAIRGFAPMFRAALESLATRAAPAL